METELRTRLQAICNQVDWGLRPQGKAVPAIGLGLVSSPRDYTMAGADGLQQYRVQADCYGQTFKAAKEVAAIVIATVEPAAGNFLGSFLLAQRDSEVVTDAGVMFVRSLDIAINFRS